MNDASPSRCGEYKKRRQRRAKHEPSSPADEEKEAERDLEDDDACEHDRRDPMSNREAWIRYERTAKKVSHRVMRGRRSIRFEKRCCDEEKAEKWSTDPSRWI